MTALALIEEEVLQDYEHVQLAEVAPTAMQLLLDLEDAGLVTARSLTLRDGTDEDAAASLVTFIAEVKNRGNFYMGDLLLDVERMLPEQFAQIAELTGFTEDTNLWVMSVCRAVPATRRRDELGWGHHVAVRNLSSRQQKRWLEKAVENGWRVGDLNRALKSAQQEERPTLEGMEPTEPNTALLLEAATSLVRNAEVAGENVIVRIEDFVRVRAALGMEEA